MSRSLGSSRDEPAACGDEPAARGDEPAARGDGPNGQVEPTAALVALFAVCVGLSLYAGVLLDSLPGESERDVASTALDVVHDRVSTGGVVDPGSIGRATRVAPAGYRLNATLGVGNRRWHVGPTPPEDVSEAHTNARSNVDTNAVADAKPIADTRTDAATRPVSVRLEPGSVRPGRLTVVVWQ